MTLTDLDLVEHAARCAMDRAPSWETRWALEALADELLRLIMEKDPVEEPELRHFGEVPL